MVLACMHAGVCVCVCRPAHMLVVCILLSTMLPVQEHISKLKASDSSLACQMPVSDAGLLVSLETFW